MNWIKSNAIVFPELIYYVTVCVHSGGVYVGRQLMTTRLPAASLESVQVITFETELAAANKVRVTIEVSEKVVTFDWTLPTRSTGPAGLNVGGLGGGLEGPVFAGPGFGSAATADKIPLNFFTRLSQPGVAITVDHCPEWIKCVTVL